MRDRKMLRIPGVLSAVIVSSVAGASCSNPSPANPDVAQQDGTVQETSTNDATVTDGPPDCSFACMNEFFPNPDGGISVVVFYPDGATSYDAICDAPPLPPQCGV